MLPGSSKPGAATDCRSNIGFVLTSTIACGTLAAAIPARIDPPLEARAELPEIILIKEETDDS
jgi:hypothetical protein